MRIAAPSERGLTWDGGPGPAALPTAPTSHPTASARIMTLKTQDVPTTSPHDVNLIVHADHWDPFSILGQHALPADGQRGRIVRAFLPEARAAWVVDLSGGEPGLRVPMEKVHLDGFFVRSFPGR